MHGLLLADVEKGQDGQQDDDGCARRSGGDEDRTGVWHQRLRLADGRFVAGRSLLFYMPLQGKRNGYLICSFRQDLKIFLGP